MSLPKPPVARKVPHRIDQLGRVRVDDYAWMKDDNWQQVLRDPKALRADVREHLDAENAYMKALLGGTEALQAQLFAEMKGRIKEDDSSVPARDGPWEYYARYAIGAEHPVHARKPRDGGEEQVLLDEDALAKGKAYFQVGAASHSPDHALYAWAADEQGSEYYTIRVKDLATGQELGAPVESAYGDFAFSPDSQWIFWIWRDENARPSKVFRRPTRGGEDVLVYEEADDGMFLGVGVASDDSHVLIHVGNQETTEIWLIPASDPTAAPIVAEARRVGVKYSLDHWTDRWVIRTNDDGAVDFKLSVSDARVPAKATWRDWIAHQPGHYITGFSIFSGHLVRAERVDALDRLVVTARDGGEHEVAFDEEAYALNLEGGY
ncbi:MAG: S9 family peptidase, partial [Phenylobacterium sp.]